MKWLHDLTGKRVCWVFRVGMFCGRELYQVTFYDGTTEDWFLDLEHETGERY